MANANKVPSKKVPSRIQSVTIEGFRSLRHIDKLELPQLTVLIGANGAGKSTLIRFFEMLSWMLKSQNLQEFVLRHGGGDDQFFMGARKTPHIRAEIQAELEDEILKYGFQLDHLSAGDSVLVLQEHWHSERKTFPVNSHTSHFGGVSREALLPENPAIGAQAICQFLSQCTTYQFHDTSVNSPIRLRWDTTDAVRLRSDGGNLAAVLLDLQANDPQRYKVIIRQIQRVLPTFKTFVLEPVAGKVDLRWQGLHSDKIFGAHLTSDGSLRLFCLLTLLNLPPERLPDVMFFDEPELGLHPHAITLVAEMLKRLAKSRQIFVATQSPYMVDCFDLENIIVAESKQGETSLRNLPREQYQSWLDDDYLLSDIWLTNPVGGL